MARGRLYVLKGWQAIRCPSPSLHTPETTRSPISKHSSHRRRQAPAQFSASGVSYPIGIPCSEIPTAPLAQRGLRAETVMTHRWYRVLHDAQRRIRSTSRGPVAQSSAVLFQTLASLLIQPSPFSLVILCLDQAPQQQSAGPSRTFASRKALQDTKQLPRSADLRPSKAGRH